MKNVQIPYDLFVALVEYHLGYDDDYEDEIRQGIEAEAGRFGAARAVRQI